MVIDPAWQILMWTYMSILPVSLIFLLVICVPCPRSYCSLCHVNLYVLLLLLLLQWQTNDGTPWWTYWHVTMFMGDLLSICIFSCLNLFLLHSVPGCLVPWYVEQLLVNVCLSVCVTDSDAMTLSQSLNEAVDVLEQSLVRVEQRSRHNSRLSSAVTSAAVRVT